MIMVQVKPMLDRINNWDDYLSDPGNRDNEELIEQHTRTVRPLGCANFIRKLESITGQELTPKKPGRKPFIRK